MSTAKQRGYEWAKKALTEHTIDDVQEQIEAGRAFNNSDRESDFDDGAQQAVEEARKL